MRIRSDLMDAQAKAWAAIGDPGTWWTGADRVAIAAETRHAAACPLCAARREALSPAMVGGEHRTLGVLPPPAEEAVHRMRTDSGRLGERWYRRLLADGLAEEQYVELVSIVAIVIAVDTFRAAIGQEALLLPASIPGAPSMIRPKGAKVGPGWAAALAPDDRSDDDPDLYRDHPGPRQRYGANVHRALSLVPNAMIHWWDLLECMYQSSPMMRDFSREYRAVTHAQIEMLAARVAALNRCHY
jgi:hypothetical protein